MSKMPPRDHISAVLSEVLREIQTISGHSCPPIVGGMKPLGGELEGFDSLLAVEATVAVEAKLGRSLKSDNLFVEDGQPLTINQTIAKIERLLTSEGQP